MYQRINGSDWCNIWLTGGLHGCFTLLTGCLHQLRFDPWANLLISVGDLIGRGPQSADHLGLLRCRRFRAIRGSYEQMTPETLESGDMAPWQMDDGDWYGRGITQQRAEVDRLLARYQRLPLITGAGYADAQHVIAHADYLAPVYHWQQPVGPQRVLWSYHHLSEHLTGRHDAIVGTDHFRLGHMPLRTPYKRDNQRYTDTGAVFGGALTLVTL